MTYAALAALLAACNGSGYLDGGGTGTGSGTNCGGTYSIACPPPTVSITAPTADASVSGTVTLSATASAAPNYNLTIASVAFQVDGVTVATVTSSPYMYSWNSTTVTNGTHTLTAVATDSAGDTETSSPVTFTVANAGAAAAALGPEQIFPAPGSKASGTARLNAQADTGALSGTVTVSGMSARAVTIHEGLAGSSGEAVLALARSASHADQWEVPAGAVLSVGQLTALAQGGLYVIATSAAHPQGEIRGQLLPDGVRVSFSQLSASAAELARGAQVAGVAAATFDANAATLTVHVDTTGLEDATAAEVAGGSGAGAAGLTRDPVDMGHFSGELAHLSAAAIADFEAGRLTVSVAAASAPQGALRGALVPDTAARGD